MEEYIQDKTFERETQLLKSEYENCRFLNCDFSNLDFSYYKFIECTFQSCNLSLLKCHQTSLRDVKFINSKMLGFRFDTCHEFGLSISFQSCLLNHSSFYKTNIKKNEFQRFTIGRSWFCSMQFVGLPFWQLQFNAFYLWPI